jgi:Phage integrase family
MLSATAREADPPWVSFMSFKGSARLEAVLEVAPFSLKTPPREWATSSSAPSHLSRGTARQPEGVVITLQRSKTDQAGEGREVAIPRGHHATTCPVAALTAWIDAAGIITGPLFRAVDRHGRIRTAGLHPDSVGAIVQRSVARAGFTAAEFGGHSLRAGFATQAARNGVDLPGIMSQTGHTSAQRTIRYVRKARSAHPPEGIFDLRTLTQRRLRAQHLHLSCRHRVSVFN